MSLAQQFTGRRRGLLAALTLAIILLATIPTGTADAHAVLVGSSPAEDEVLEETPDTVVLRFSEPVELLDDSLQLFDAAGDPLDAGPVDQSDGDDTIVLHVTAELEGSIVVSWRAVSLDSHVISGAYTFAVGARTAVDPALLPSASGSGTTWPDRFVGVGSWMTFLGIAGLVGGIAVLLTLAPTALAERRTARLLRLAAATGLAGTVLMLGAQSALIANGPLDPDAWNQVLGLTSGRWWFVRAVGFVVALVGLAIAVRLRSISAWRALGAFAAVVIVPAAVLGGHAIAGDRAALGVASTIVHVLAMAIWVGGLMLLVAVVATADLPRVLRHFSPVATVCVAVLVITGLVNSWRQLGGIDDLVDTTFGRWLLIKLAVVALVLVAAGLNTWSLRRSGSPAGTEITVRRGAALESVGMVVVLAATAGLSNSTPPASVVTLAAPVSVTAVQDDLRARIDVLPARTGGTTLNVMIYGEESDLAAADEITVTASLPAQGLGPLPLPVTAVGPNQLSTDGVDFPAPGDWTVEVTARFGEFDQTVFSATVEID